MVNSNAVNRTMIDNMDVIKVLSNLSLSELIDFKRIRERLPEHYANLDVLDFTNGYMQVVSDMSIRYPITNVGGISLVNEIVKNCDSLEPTSSEVVMDGSETKVLRITSYMTNREYMVRLFNKYIDFCLYDKTCKYRVSAKMEIELLPRMGMGDMTIASDHLTQIQKGLEWKVMTTQMS